MKSNVDDLINEINHKKQKAIDDGTIRKEKPQIEISEKDINYNLPDGWRWVRLGDYCLKVTDYVASGSFAAIKSNVNYYDTENYALMVKTADFSNNFTKNLTYTDESSYKFLSNSNLFGGELILSNIGSIGKVFKVPYLNRPMTLASNTIMVKFTDDELSDYIYHYFKSPYGQNALMSISSGTSMLKFNKTQLKTLVLPIPSLETQKKIVEVLDKAQELIDKRKEQIEALDELVKSRFIEMFGDPVTNPMNWDKQVLKELVTDDCNISYGIVQTGDEQKEGIPVFRPVDIVNNKKPILNELKKTTEEISNRYKKTILQGNELLMTVRANIGDTCIINEEFKGCNVGRGIVPIRLSEGLNTIFVKYQFDSYGVQRELKSLAKGITLIQLNMEDLREFLLIIPPVQLQNEFADFVKQVDKLKLEMENSLKELEDNLNSLMQKAFKGELF